MTKDKMTQEIIESLKQFELSMEQLIRINQIINE